MSKAARRSGPAGFRSRHLLLFFSLTRPAGILRPAGSEGSLRSVAQENGGRQL